MKKIYDKKLTAPHMDNYLELEWIDVEDDSVDLYGFVQNHEEDILSCRIPSKIAEMINEGVAGMHAYAAGGRARFVTNSRIIAVRAEYGEGGQTHLSSPCWIWGFDLYTVNNHREIYLHTYLPNAPDLSNTVFESICELEDNLYIYKDREGSNFSYTLNFPCYSELKKVYIGIQKGSSIENGAKYQNDSPVIFYGSSITQGAAASRPGTTYEALISQKYNLNYINLGFAGNAKGEAQMAKYIAGRNMAAFVCDYDHNAPSNEYLRDTHYHFYEVIREQNPLLPYLMISRPDIFLYPDVYLERRDIIRSTYERAMREGDTNVYYIDGGDLFAGELMENCTVDGCHPNDLGFYRMANTIGNIIVQMLARRKT